MVQTFKLFCPTLSCNVTIRVSIPKNYKSTNLVFDSLYMLDGQNIFNDKDATFGRSMRLEKYLKLMKNHFNKNICCIAIDSPKNDLERLNLYSPFTLSKELIDFGNQTPKKSNDFTYDLINTIIPYIRKNYPVSKEPANTFIHGSSLGALYAVYVANTYHEYFGGAGIFSLCNFLCKNDFYKYLDIHLNKKLKTYIYVGKYEVSDDLMDNSLYYNETINFKNYLAKNNCKHKLSIDINGIHNEATWEKHLLDFLSFMYFDDIEITK